MTGLGSSIKKKLIAITKFQIRPFRRKFPFHGQSYELNTLSGQKRYWGERLLNYDINNKRLCGYDWGDPNEAEAREDDGRILGNYLKVKEEYFLPFLNDRCTIMEIGCGGGKWTRYMLGAGKIVCVDIIDESFSHIKRKLPPDKITFYKTAGNELTGILDHSIDFIFSMDTFVRIPKEFIFDYFKEFSRVLRYHGKICLHLPCNDMIGCTERKFVDLSRDEIKKLCIDNGFNDFYIDDQTIKHGVILRVNYEEK